MLKTFSIKPAKSKKDGVKVDDDNKNKYNSIVKLEGKDKIEGVDNNKVDGSEIRDNEVAKERND